MVAEPLIVLGATRSRAAGWRPDVDRQTGAPRGYSGCGRLDIWVYPSKAAALREGAKLAMACGLDEDAQATMLFAKGSYEKVLERYEHTHPDTHLLRVQPAFLQHPE